MFPFTLLLGTPSNSNESTTLCVRIHGLIKSFLLVSTAAQSNTSVCIDAALLLCQHVCVKGPGRTDATGLWKSKPISVSKSWGMALCIQTCFNQADTLWQWQDLVHKEGRGWTHCGGSWQPHVALTDCVRVCTCCYLWCHAWLAILPMLQSYGLVDDPAWVMWTFLPLATNNSSTTVTLSNGDDWTRSWLTAELLAE